MRRENWVALGLVAIIVGLLFLAFSNSPVYGDNYTSKGSIDNNINYAAGKPPEVSVSGYFEAGQHFFFNFTKGTYWGLKYDQDNGLEPAITDFAPNTSINPHKIVSFDLYTPSSDRIDIDVYVSSGTDPFAVVYLNQSVDFVPLEGGNLSFTKVGMEGTVNRSGNFTVKATAIVPLIMRNINQTYTITTDPPAIMSLWNIDTVQTRPYFVPFIAVGTLLVLSGAVSGVWGGKSRRRKGHLKKTSR